MKLHWFHETGWASRAEEPPQRVHASGTRGRAHSGHRSWTRGRRTGAPASGHSARSVGSTRRTRAEGCAAAAHRQRSSFVSTLSPTRPARHGPTPSRRRAGRALILYAESSAVVAWLFGEAAGRRTVEALERADSVTASDLTLLECDRSLVRAMALSLMGEERAALLRSSLAKMVTHWRLMPVSREIVNRARQPFPGEPIRSLDAIHLASALAAADSLPEFGLLSLDRRVRATGARLGLRVLPE
jgi:predicted nucleic acid-binding protein